MQPSQRVNDCVNDFAKDSIIDFTPGSKYAAIIGEKKQYLMQSEKSMKHERMKLVGIQS